MKKLTPNYDEGMWKGAPAESFSKAQFLRTVMTKAEVLLWEKLKNNQFDGLKFRRQHPVHFYIADFYCHKYKLVIELDGDYHFTQDQMKKDHERTRMLEENGLTVIRFKNEMIETSIDEVLASIHSKVEKLKMDQN